MKIISKIKDYYDYLTGIHGIDPVLVYDRRHESIATMTNAPLVDRDEPETFTFYICNKRYRILAYGGRYYFGVYDLFLLFQKIRERHDGFKYKQSYANVSFKYNFPLTQSNPDYLRRRARTFFREFCITPTEINKKEREPVLMERYGKLSLPVLSTTPIPSIIPADEIYNEISMFLGWMNDNPAAPQIIDNKSKIKAAGFDPKISFRHRK